MKFRVVVEEVYQKVIVVEAENFMEAEETAYTMWDNKEFKITANDFVECNTECIEKVY